jgi:hypothetical protein
LEAPFVPILHEEGVCDLEEFTSIALAVLALLRELHGVDPASEKHRDGQQIVDRLVEKSFRKENHDEPQRCRIA